MYNFEFSPESPNHFVPEALTRGYIYCHKKFCEFKETIVVLLEEWHKKLEVLVRIFKLFPTHL